MAVEGCLVNELEFVKVGDSRWVRCPIIRHSVAYHEQLVCAHTQFVRSSCAATTG
ncbi:MAG: hypothetical protein IID16_10915 [Candidatus Marinimicrobia bacterium]|nr:hypothetical protein [Candidatus Neomarinimicrobiota bacterium]